MIAVLARWLSSNVSVGYSLHPYHSQDLSLILTLIFTGYYDTLPMVTTVVNSGEKKMLVNGVGC